MGIESITMAMENKYLDEMKKNESKYQETLTSTVIETRKEEKEIARNEMQLKMIQVRQKTQIETEHKIRTALKTQHEEEKSRLIEDIETKTSLKITLQIQKEEKRKCDEIVEKINQNHQWSLDKRLEQVRIELNQEKEQELLDNAKRIEDNVTQSLNIRHEKIVLDQKNKLLKSKEIEIKQLSDRAESHRQRLESVSAIVTKLETRLEEKEHKVKEYRQESSKSSQDTTKERNDRLKEKHIYNEKENKYQQQIKTMNFKMNEMSSQHVTSMTAIQKEIQDIETGRKKDQINFEAREQAHLMVLAETKTTLKESMHAVVLSTENKMNLNHTEMKKKMSNLLITLKTRHAQEIQNKMILLKQEQEEALTVQRKDDKTVRDTLIEEMTQLTQQVTQQVTQKVTEEVTKDVTEEVTKQVTKEVTQTVTQKVTEEVTREVTKEVTKEVTEAVTKEVTEVVTEAVTRKVEKIVFDNVTAEVTLQLEEKHRIEIDEMTTEIGIEAEKEMALALNEQKDAMDELRQNEILLSVQNAVSKTIEQTTKKNKQTNQTIAEQTSAAVASAVAVAVKKEREEAQPRQVAVLEALEAQVTSQTRAQDDAVRALQEQLNVATSKLGTELFNQNEKDTENDNEMSGCVKETQEEMKEKEESKAKGFEVEELQTVPSSEMNL